ncbi:flavin-containing monooxygenase [Actinocrispum wychmicini]|uniref:Cation diffusion facilitator CzcD-associated flavoprotein CzcO n=1 Tax=Actinocrispum wychmicini TaxID=1213861 RepID=A0A4R2J4R6_9PSEU|nr:NAD(P)/FAD-dependent oxidoreductase [Actinocrispum wychmicini]TCO52817.1 cation diffusion facilitator CzcD-associated flavoprotein CzcO [Actinocrispum wychmicini]
MTSTVNDEINKQSPAGTVTGGKPTPHVQVAIIGTGFSGLGVAVKLLENKVTDFVVLERADEVGGTWRDNTYPGVACDVMALLYVYSFAQKSDWKSTFGTRDELFDYLRGIADRYGVRPHIKFNHEVVGAQWDERLRRWNIQTSQGDYTAQVLVAGSGYLSDPVIPNIPGINEFQGKIMHSSKWDHSYDVKDRKVAVIGTGASAIQFVPAIQPEVGHLDLYQRSAPWVMPKPDKPNKGLHGWALKNFPGYRAFRRGFNKRGREILSFIFSNPNIAAKTVQGNAEKYLKKSVPDAELRARLTPNFVVACKRLLFSNKWYPAIQADNVEIIDGEVGRVTPTGIVGSDGKERAVDAIILGTGFQATKRPIAAKLTGRAGITLEQQWDRSGMKAYRGTTVAGFPNLFLMLGPNTTLGHSSQTLMIEAQMNYVIDAVNTINKRGLASVEVQSDVQERYNEFVEKAIEGTAWDPATCNSWYVDSTGRNPSLWPMKTSKFTKSTKKFDVQAYQVATLTGAEKHVRVQA